MVEKMREHQDGEVEGWELDNARVRLAHRVPLREAGGRRT